MKKLLSSIIILNAVTLFSQDSQLEKIIENTHDYRQDMHQILISTAKGIDNIFDDSEEEIEGYDKTYGLIQLSSFFDEGEDVQFDQRISLKFKLPKLKRNLKNKVKLLLENGKIRENSDYTEDETHNLDLSLQYEDYLGENISFKTKGGVRLGNGLNLFIKSEIKKVIEDIQGIDYTFSQSIKESIQDNLELTSYIRLDKPLNDIYSLHNYYEYYWQPIINNDSKWYTSIYLIHRVSDKNTLTYTLGSNINNIDSNSKVKRYNATVKFRHWLRKWIFIDIIPENYYDEKENFNSAYSIKFSLGIYINKDSYKQKK